MTRDDCRAIRSAANELSSWAKHIRDSCTVPGDRDDWKGEEGAKNTHDKHLELAKRLRAIANTEQQKRPPPRRRRTYKET